MPHNPPLHSFLPSIISLLSRVFLLLSRQASFNQYSSRTNANKHLRIHHHLRVLVSRGLYKALLYFLYFTLLMTRPVREICQADCLRINESRPTRFLKSKLQQLLYNTGYQPQWRIVHHVKVRKDKLII